MKLQRLQRYCRNWIDTARAFIERYETEHKKALQAARDSIADIADYIARYRQAEIERDASGANSVRG